ncbi:MAG: agmatinase [Candidatus Hadarchaeales archaeon]
MWVPVKPPFGGFESTYESSQVAVMGVPLDLTSTYRSGSRFAPQRIREASFNLETYIPSAGADVFEKLQTSDLGDLWLPPDLQEAGKLIEGEVRRVLGDGKLPLLLGGEHTLTYFACRAARPDFVLYLDAHADLREEWAGQTLCHATVARRLLEFLPPTRLLLVGLRSLSREEMDFIRGTGLLPVYADRFSDPLQLGRKVKEECSGKVYLSLDMDLLDPAFAPGVSCPEPGGISTSQLLEFLRGLRGVSLCGVDVVEVCPPFDSGNCASFAAARAIYELLAHLV